MNETKTAPAAGCGDCTLCCKVMRIEEYASPQGEWCKHCDPKAGCTIYETRAQRCRDFECVWLQSQKLTEGKASDWRMEPELRPDRVHAVIDVATDGQRLIAHVDSQYPEAHKRGPLARWIDGIVKRGGQVIVVRGAARTLFARRAA